MGLGMGNGATSSSSSRLDSAPLLPHHGGGEIGLSSQPKTFANVFIAVVGAGVLGLPYTFSHTGWAAGTLLLLAVAALTFYCMMLLVACRRRLADEHPKLASFGDLGDAVFGAQGRFAVDAMLVLSQASFCIGYLIFISNTMAHLYPIFAPSSSALLSPKALFIWAMLPFQLGLNSIRTLTLLAPLSIFADVVDLGAMGVVLGQDVAAWLASPPPVMAFNGPAALLYGLGVSVYAFEGIGMVLPLEAEAADKKKFGVTLGLSMTFVALMYGLFGAMGYIAFGDATRDIITTNLGAGWLSAAVQLGLCINLFFTMPVMMHPVYEVAERLLHGKLYCWWLRWLLVIAVGLSAMYVPNFTDFLALVGSSVCVLLGFVLPGSFHLKVFGAEMGCGPACSRTSCSSCSASRSPCSGPTRHCCRSSTRPAFDLHTICYAPRINLLGALVPGKLVALLCTQRSGSDPHFSPLLIWACILWRTQFRP